jgi:hypothetical protein
MNKFWSNDSGVIKVDPESLRIFLKENGYGIFKTGELDGAILVKTEGRIIKTVTAKEIRDFCWTYIDQTFEFPDPNERKQVISVFYREKSLFSYDNLLLLPKIEIQEINDTAGCSYLFFSNCIVEITAEKARKLRYDEIKGHICSRDIINFELESEDIEEDSGDFSSFMNAVCIHDDDEVEDHNVLSLMTIIGYVLHRHKDPSKAKAIIFMDPYRGEGANGGTGKSLLTKAFEKIRPTVFEDGKYFHTKERFALSQVSYNTRVLVIDDIPNNFDFSKLFPLITEKAVVERKYQNKITIHFERSPKIVITTNYSINAEDDSSRRRKFEFVFSDHFSPDLTPEELYGRLFFIEWDKEEWEFFYKLMITCIRTYLINGLVAQGYNTAERALKLEAHPKFIEYAKANISLGNKYNKRTVYADYYSKHSEVGKVEMTTFRKWLKLFADANGYKFNESHSGNDSFFEFSKE